jgi:hypothetical protein
MNQLYIPKEPNYIYRPWMSGGTFKAKGVDYIILEGTWLMKEGISVDAIRFREKNGNKTFVLPESEFYYKIKIENIKIK